MSQEVLDNAPLGKSSVYKQYYDASLLFPIERAANRAQLALGPELPFFGVDIWNAYECSWLNMKGKPQVAVARFEFPATSSHLIESKSFKLYLNSFNQSQFAGFEQVQTTLQADLSKACGADIKVVLFNADEFSDHQISAIEGECIDNLDIDITHYDIVPDLLHTNGDKQVEEILYSHLLKSNCPVTGQPDWATVYIRYKGKQINHAALLRYIISFRHHDEFHEMCVERMFSDLMRYCQCELLTVYARYTRRGGLDINPFRSNFAALPSFMRLARQ